MDSEWNAFEALLLRTMDPAARQRRLLPVLLRPCELPELIAALEKVDLTAERYWERELKRLVRDIEDVIPVPPPWQERGGIRHWTQWRRWLRRYRRELRLGAAAVIALWLVVSLLLQWPPFQPRLGWQALGLHAKYAWRLSRAGDVLLVSTTTDILGCQAADTGLQRSTDQGATWHSVVAPLKFTHPSLGCVLAAVEDFAPAAVPSPRIYAATSDVGLLRSDDAGQQWAQVGKDALPAKLQGVAVALTDHDLVFAAAAESGLYRSRDGGANWQRLDDAAACPTVSDKIPLPTSFKVGAMLASTEALYVGDESQSLGTYPGPAAGLYVSRDGGTCWQRLDKAEGRYSYVGLAAVPGTADQLLVLTFDHAATPSDFPYQLWYLQGAQGRTRLLWQSRHTTTALYVDSDPPLMWYVANWVGEIFYGSLDSTGTGQSLPRVIRCLSPLAACMADLAPDFQPGPPLLLIGDRLYRLEVVPWYRWLWP